MIFANKIFDTYNKLKESQILHKRHTVMLEILVLSVSNPISARKTKFTFRLFTECINLCDVCENIFNTKKLTINLLPEQQYESYSKLGNGILLWIFQQ